MGQFSWLDCCDHRQQILDGFAKTSYLLVPQEFQDEYGSSIEESCYDGYGIFGKYDVYDLVADWNKKYINLDNFTSKGLDIGSPESYGGLWPFEKEKLVKSGLSPEEIANLDKEAKQMHYDAAKQRAEHDLKQIKDFCEGKPDSYMRKTYGDDYKRLIGITLACWDEDNFKLKYPIKITYYSGAIYENCGPSPSDPNQGWFDADRQIKPIVAEWLGRQEDALIEAMDDLDADDASFENVDCEDLLVWIGEHPRLCKSMMNYLDFDVRSWIWEITGDYDFGDYGRYKITNLSWQQGGKQHALTLIAEGPSEIILPERFNYLVEGTSCGDMDDLYDRISEYVHSKTGMSCDKSFKIEGFDINNGPDRPSL